MLNLASQSPRRRELLTQLGVEFRLLDVNVDETQFADEPARLYVERVARSKAAAGRALCGPGQVVLAADTSVVCGSQVFGKPASPEQARSMLQQLSGGWHEVISAVVVIDASDNARCVLVTSRVLFIALDSALIDAYLGSGEGQDKAGAYAIQGLGGALVERIEGSYSAVVGLPLAETRALLDGAGVQHGLSVSPSPIS